MDPMGWVIMMFKRFVTTLETIMTFLPRKDGGWKTTFIWDTPYFQVANC